MAEQHPNLFSEFRTPDYSEWLAIAREELQGTDPEQSLAWQVADLQCYPYYTREHLRTKQAINHVLTPWQNIPLITVASEAAGNAQALEHLNQGADGILFYIPEPATISPEKLLEKIEWPHCTLSFLLNEDDGEFSVKLRQFIDKKKYSLNELIGSFYLKTYPHRPQTINNIVHNLIPYTNLDCIGLYISSGQPVERLATGLAHAVQSVEQLAASGISAQVSLQRISFIVETGNDFFIEAASLRALRFLWYQVLQAYGAADYHPSDLYLQAISTCWIDDELGPHSNMLKSTTAAIAAITGGCNALTVLPEKEADTRMVRIARNVSNLLKEESRLDKVTDPLAGSFYLESLTWQLIEKVWTSFQQKTVAR
ncbi:MAG: methylmalonyl-CoA mutase family protein [Cyclobacteriaceae bacterium]|nr:methylmalonyl-CoA mutase family protein [Cyclobacteriaceae bacterium]